jgi:hypothetical protein
MAGTANMRPNAKGRKKAGGRVKGTPNKVTQDLRKMALAALDDVGGVEYLVKMAIVEPKSFLSLLSKCMPKELHLDATINVTHTEIVDALVAGRDRIAAARAAEEQRSKPAPKRRTKATAVSSAFDKAGAAKTTVRETANGN